MIFDLSKDLYLVFISGFISISVYRYRRNKRFTKINGEKYVMLLLAYGAVSFATFLAAKYCLKFLPFFASIDINLISLLTFLFFSISGLFWGYFFSENSFVERFETENNLFRIPGLNPETSGLVEMDFAETIKNVPRHEIYIFDLECKKVYVGFLMLADIDDNMPSEEKVIKIVPLKSGYRTEPGLEVHYNIFYVSDEQIAVVIEDTPDAASIDDALQSIVDIEQITIFQRELISYRKYSAKLNTKFTSKKTNSNSLQV